MQDEIWHQFGIQNYNGNVLSVYSVDLSEEGVKLHIPGSVEIILLTFYSNFLPILH